MDRTRDRAKTAGPRSMTVKPQRRKFPKVTTRALPRQRKVASASIRSKSLGEVRQEAVSSQPDSNPFQELNPAVPLIGVIATALGVLTTRISGLDIYSRIFAIIATGLAIASIGIAIASPLFNRQSMSRKAASTAATVSIVLLTASILMAGYTALIAITISPLPPPPSLTVSQVIDNIGNVNSGTGEENITTTITATITFHNLGPGEVATLRISDHTNFHVLGKAAFTAGRDGIVTDTMTAHNVPMSHNIDIVAETETPTPFTHFCQITINPSGSVPDVPYCK